MIKQSQAYNVKTYSNCRKLISRKVAGGFVPNRHFSVYRCTGGGGGGGVGVGGGGVGSERKKNRETNRLVVANGT